MTDSSQQVEQAVETAQDVVPQILHAVLWIAIAVVVVVVIDRLVTKLLRRILKSGNLPMVGSKIIINIVRGIIWFLGLAVVLEAGFNIDITALVAALGVGGIAVSLGLQDTISNLFGGIQISMNRLFEIGQIVEVGGVKGAVVDFNWRHATIKDASGDIITIPNSVLNKSALTVHPDYIYSETGILVKYSSIPDGKTLDDVIARISNPIREAVQEVAEVQSGPTFRFTRTTEFGYEGTVAFETKSGVLAPVVVDAVVREISKLGV